MNMYSRSSQQTLISSTTIILQRIKNKQESSSYLSHIAYQSNKCLMTSDVGNNSLAPVTPNITYAIANIYLPQMENKTMLSQPNSNIPCYISTTLLLTLLLRLAPN